MFVCARIYMVIAFARRKGCPYNNNNFYPSEIYGLMTF